MPRIQARLRRVGSSLGIIIPNDVARKLRLQVGDTVFLDIGSSGVREAFGSLRDWDVDPQKLKAELGRGW